MTRGRENTVIVLSVHEAAIHEINDLEKRIVSAEDDADEKLWNQARVVVAQLDAGLSQRTLAAQWINVRTGDPYDHKHVYFVKEVWQRFGEFTPQDRPRFRDAYNTVANQPGSPAGMNKPESNDWYTPSQYIEAARKVLGDIDLDPASCEDANKTVKAAQIFTLKENGLKQPWHGRVWMNPPYSGDAGAFIERLTQCVRSGDVSAAVVLVNSHGTDTQSFQPLWDALLCFTNHRINFISPTGEEQSGSNHGSVFAYFGPHRELFVREFSVFGTVVERARE